MFVKGIKSKQWFDVPAIYRNFAGIMKELSFDKWLKKNPSADLAALMLRAGNDEEKKRMALQHYCRRKASSKLPALTAIGEFVFPTALSAEQCTSELLASYHVSLVEAGATAADLTAGLGVDSFSLARRCRSLTSVELDPTVCRALSHNAELLGYRNMTVVNSNCMEWIETAGQFDTIFIDPYRRGNEGGRVFALSDCTPDVVGNLDLLLSHCSELIIKASPMLEATRIAGELGRHVRKIIFLGTRNECKETIVICDMGTHGNPAVEAVTLADNGLSWCFAPHHDEANARTIYATPKVGDILMEPFPAVMKTGAYEAFASAFDVAPLARDTHLFVCKADVANLALTPAHCFSIERVMPFDKRTCRALSKEFSHLNVAVRNFPIKAPELEKRLNMKPGGNHKLYGATLSDGSATLLLVEPFRAVPALTSRTCEP